MCKTVKSEVTYLKCKCILVSYVTELCLVASPEGVVCKTLLVGDRPMKTAKGGKCNPCKKRKMKEPEREWWGEEEEKGRGGCRLM